MRDLRLTFRQLLHTPGYSAMVVLTLALTIGANSAVFSAVNAVLMRPLPVVEPERALVVWQTDTASGGQAVIELTLLGALAAAGGARAFGSLLFDVAPSDPMTFGAVVVFVIVATALAAYIPGRHASRTEVNMLLRHF